MLQLDESMFKGNRYKKLDEGAISGSTKKLSYDELADLERRLYAKLKEDNIYPEDGTFYNSPNRLTDLELTLVIDGDWKHDHLACQEIVEDFLNENNLALVKHSQIEIGNSESDSYKAEHKWDICFDDENGTTKERISGFRSLLGEAYTLRRKALNEAITPSQIVMFVRLLKELAPVLEKVLTSETFTALLTGKQPQQNTANATNESIDNKLVETILDIGASNEEPEMQNVADTGIANEINSLIRDEYETIEKYNNIVPNLENYQDMIPVIQDIVAEENTHVGQLQKLLGVISPNVENINKGEEEAQEQLDDQATVIVSMDDDIGIDDQMSRYVSSLGEKINENYTPFNPDEWEEEDIEKYKTIDWSQTKHGEWEDPDDEFEADVVKITDDPTDADDNYKIVKMHKFFRQNPIYPPYYRAVEDPFEGTVGPMYDGNKHGKYDIHDRYETQSVYDMLSR